MKSSIDSLLTAVKQRLRGSALPNANLVRIGTVLIVAAIGLYLLDISHAATVWTGSEAESGSLDGDANTISDSGASGGNAVVFGGGISPSNLQVFTGGNNIALVWNMPTKSVKNIEVWRDNVQIATVTPNSSAPFQNGQLGKEYDDSSVIAGSTYQYKVRAVLTDGTVSSFTPAVSATQPKTTQPVPSITVDTSGAPDLASYMNNYVVPLLQTWYPKVANEIAYPNYTAPTSYGINFSSSVGTAGDFCYTSGAQISCDPNEVRGCAAQGQSCAAIFVHESTHVIQSGGNGSPPSWVIEGGASWGSDFYARQNINNFVPHLGEPLGGYSEGAWFIEYMRENYDASFPKDVNVGIHSAANFDSIVSQDTGGQYATADAAWQTEIAAYNSSVGAVSGIVGKCAEVQNGTVGYGTKLIVDTCNNQNLSESLNVVFKSGIAGKCLDDWGGSSNTNADLYSCNGTGSQIWKVNSDGTIEGTSGGCLDNTPNANGNQVTLAACNAGSSTQQWVVSGTTIKNISTGKCLDDPGSATLDSTALDMAICSGSAAQKWTKTGGTTLTGDFPQQWALTYHNTSKTGKFEITSPNLGNITGTSFCMDVLSSGTADGTVVQYWGCNQTNAQMWTHGANGTIVNVNAGKCLATAGGSSANGTGLVIRTCDGGADEQWSTPL